MSAPVIQLTCNPRRISLKFIRYDAFVFEFASGNELWSCAAFIAPNKPVSHLSFYPTRCSIASYKDIRDYCPSATSCNICSGDNAFIRSTYFGGDLGLSAWKTARPIVCNAPQTRLQQAFEDAANAFHSYVDFFNGSLSPKVPEPALEEMAAITQSLANAQRKLVSLDKQLTSLRSKNGAYKQENAALKSTQLKLERQVDSLQRTIVVGNATLKTENANLKQEILALKAKCFDIAFEKGA